MSYCDDMWICEEGKISRSCEIKIMMGKCEKYKTLADLKKPDNSTIVSGATDMGSNACRAVEPHMLKGAPDSIVSQPGENPQDKHSAQIVTEEKTNE